MQLRRGRASHKAGEERQLSRETTFELNLDNYVLEPLGLSFELPELPESPERLDSMSRVTSRSTVPPRTA